jgi:hypothetical protein
MPLYEHKSLILGTYLAIFPDRVIYQESRVKPRTVVPIRQIASVITSMLLATITVVTTGNKKIRMHLPRAADKKEICVLLERLTTETIPAL